MSDFTPMKQTIYDEIERYYNRMGKWPSIALIRSITKFNQSSMQTRIKRMIEDDILEYASEFHNGKSRLIRIK
tara:strand:+ start:42 stop:260 length:219 start_codon:yes stop_codon:yes gene_type:complete